MLAFRPADAHDAGFQAVEWPQEGRLMLMPLAFRPHEGRLMLMMLAFRPFEWPQEGRLMLMTLAFRPSGGHRRVG